MELWTTEIEASFEAYVESLIEVIENADRSDSLGNCCPGLMMPVARKSVEPRAGCSVGGSRRPVVPTGGGAVQRRRDQLSNQMGSSAP
jgi:SRSO17 transposase